MSDMTNIVLSSVNFLSLESYINYNTKYCLYVTNMIKCVHRMISKDSVGSHFHLQER